MKRYAGDVGETKGESKPSVDPDLSGRRETIEERQSNRDRRIAVVGGGVAGLTAAYYLTMLGYSVVVFEKNDVAGGALWREEVQDRLPEEVLTKELQEVLDKGFEIRYNERITREGLTILKQHFEVLLLATGHDGSIDYENEEAVFVTPRASKMAVRAVAHGKELAKKAEQYLNDIEVTGSRKRFNSRFGKLHEEEYAEYLKESVNEKRQEAEKLELGLSADQVRLEASRCLRCDCRKADNCSLRDFADSYSANQRRYWDESRQRVTKQIQPGGIIYEPAKCIKCGICVRITKQYGEEFGFTFIGRGFDVKLGIPFNEKLDQALVKTANLVAEACPTGALAKQS